MARPVISYDDITLPYQATSPTQPRSYSPKPSPAKKRKWNKKPKGRSSQSFNNNYNNAGPGAGSSSMAVDAEDENAEEDEESRDLTHNEIWDDSALIDAWNAATEEYEAYNGPDKGWKAEPVHKSPLWYNTPRPKGKAIAPTTTNGTFSVPSVPESTAQGDSLPLNFDTFIPSHDPSLAVPIPEPPPIVGAEGLSQAFSDVPGAMVSQDEAFTRAMGAMYWSGYWTAMYHCQRRLSQELPAQGTAQEGEEDPYDEAGDEEDEEDVEDEAFVSTQR